MKEEVSCEYKNTDGLLQKFEKSCYGSIKSKNFFGMFHPAWGHKGPRLGQTTSNEVSFHGYFWPQARAGASPSPA